MSLNGAVDAPQNTGIASYRQVFFSPDYVARNPERAELVEKLRVAIDEQVNGPLVLCLLFFLIKSLQVKTIDSCLKLHGLLCPPEFIPFHETLVKFFRRHFRDEIRRLAVDDNMSDSISNLSRTQLHSVLPSSTTTGYYETSSYEQSLKRSGSSASTARFGTIPPIQVSHSLDILPSLLPTPITGDSPSMANNDGLGLASKQTPLQRHLAHLARHGINGVSSAPENPATTSLSTGSPHNSFVHVGHPAGSSLAGGAQTSGASGSASYMGSLHSFGSIKGRLSRFGSLSLSFAKRGAKDFSA